MRDILKLGESLLMLHELTLLQVSSGTGGSRIKFKYQILTRCQLEQNGKETSCPGSKGRVRN
jgi:hypothetical protein